MKTSNFTPSLIEGSSRHERLEGAATRIETLLRLHVEQTTENAVMLLDRDGTIIWCNATATRTFGYAADELVGLPLQKLFTPEDTAKGIPQYELHVAGHSNDVHNDRWMMRADGSKFWALGTTTALRDEKGDVIGFGKLLRNGTDVKEQIETLRNRAEELLKADEHKNLFFSTLSHELRNPLAPLGNALQLIRMARPGDQALNYPVKLIERQVDFIRRLVDDMLDETRMRSGKIQLDLQEVDVREVIERAVETSRPQITERRHRLKQYMLDVPIVVNADIDRLQQVFVNLLSNAAKYTPEGGEIEIRASMEQSEASVRFLDNGIGIPADMLPHVFELFTRGETAAKEARDGLGIGLSLVKQLVELQGGSVQVRSEGPSQGCEFTVRLPLARALKADGA